jgi:hypothetical protein
MVRKLVALRYRGVEEGREFEALHFNRMLAGISKKDILARYRAAADYAENYAFQGDELESWDGGLHLFGRRATHSQKVDELSLLQRVYPQAKAYPLVADGGSLLSPELIQRIKDILLP